MFRRKTYKAKKRVLIENLESRQLLAGDGLSATYFQNADLTDPVFQRLDPGINYQWGSGSPDASIDAGDYSVRWTGKLLAPKTETYTFYLSAADGVRGFANGILFINDWQVRLSPNENVLSAPLVAGQTYNVKVEYFSSSGAADVSLKWSSATTPKEVIAGEHFYSGTPVITAGPSASPNLVSGATTNLSVAATDDKAEEFLTYSWSIVAKPEGASNPTLSENNNNTAKNTTATFTRAGQYVFAVKVADAGGRYTTANVTVNVTPAQLGLLINAGGSAAGNFGPDGNFNGGTASNDNFNIDTSGVQSPAPQSVYQSARYGNFTYTVSDLTPGKLYSVRLHFSENYWTARNQRVFDVKANGITRLDDYDIYAEAGNREKAVTETFNLVADDAGKIALQFITQKDNAQVNGIEISPVTNFVYVKDFGAAGDGVANDAPKIQAAINAAPAGATIVLEAGKTYKLNTGLLVNKSLNFEGNGATLKLNTSASPQNKHLFVESQLAGDSYTWTVKPSVGQTSYNVAIPTDKIKAGDTVYLQLGQDPYDPFEENFSAIAKVISNNGSTIVLDKAVPYTISMGSFVNRITKITSLVKNTYMHNVRFDYFNGTIPDVQVWTSIVKNFAMDRIRGRYTILLNAADSDGVFLNDVQGQLTFPHNAAGRVFTAWHGDHTHITNVDVSTSTDSTTFLLESWTHNVTVNNYKVDWNFTGSPSSAVFHLTGGSYNNRFDNVTINNAGPIKLSGSGTQPASYTFGTVTVTGTLIFAPLVAIDRLITAGHDFNSVDLVTDTFTIDVQSNWSNKYFELCVGTVKSVSFTLSSKQGVNIVYMFNAQGQGYNVTSSLVSGQTVTLGQLYGTDYPFNNPNSQPKNLRLYTGNNVLAGTKLTVTVTYFPE